MVACDQNNECKYQVCYRPTNTCVSRGSKEAKEMFFKYPVPDLPGRKHSVNKKVSVNKNKKVSQKSNNGTVGKRTDIAAIGKQIGKHLIAPALNAIPGIVSGMISPALKAIPGIVSGIAGGISTGIETTKYYISDDDPIIWDQKPGTDGFNNYARDRLSNYTFSETCDITRLQPWQQCVQLLTSKQIGGLERLLIVQRTGLGKTRCMVEILNNLYEDTRAKLVMFPTHDIAINFYITLMTTDSKYQQYLIQHQIDVFDSRMSNVEAVIDLLAMKHRMKRAGEEGELYSPLRAIQYVIGGGTTSIPINGSTVSNNSILKYGIKKKTSVYDNMIVVADEFHNLVRPSAEAKPYEEKLVALRKEFYRADNLALFGLTATPVDSSLENELQPLLDIIMFQFKHSPPF